ncbi:M15 family metallopeptidase, partial [Streptomyces sp. MCAF7]
MRNDFVFIDEYMPGVRWDAKYATWDNFTGKPVDGYLANRIVGTRALCATLQTAREEAASHGFGLLLWDGYR